MDRCFFLPCTLTTTIDNIPTSCKTAQGRAKETLFLGIRGAFMKFSWRFRGASSHSWSTLSVSVGFPWSHQTVVLLGVSGHFREHPCPVSSGEHALRSRPPFFSLGDSEPSAQKHSFHTPWGTFRPGPLGSCKWRPGWQNKLRTHCLIKHGGEHLS